MIKQLFCKHEWKRELITHFQVGGGVIEKQVYKVCKKCGKMIKEKDHEQK